MFLSGRAAKPRRLTENDIRPGEAQLPTRLAMLASARLFEPELRERGFAQLIDVLKQPLQPDLK